MAGMRNNSMEHVGYQWQHDGGRHVKFLSLIIPFFFVEDLDDIPGHVFTRGMIAAVSMSVVVVCLVIVGVIYRVDLALFYRHFMGRDETLTGNKYRHAGISYPMVLLRNLTKKH